MKRDLEHNTVTDLKVAYIGGGSRGWAWGFMQDLAMDPQICGEVCLYDVDASAAKRNEIIGNRISQDPEALSRWHYTVADTLEQALTGADFTVISILPATFDEMNSDVHAPERLGIYQPVGDTVGPGGFMRAVRTLPMYKVIAEAIRDYAPDTWVINYTNPMSLCVRALYEVFPQVKAFGCCHEVFGTQKLLCAMLKSKTGIEADRHELYTTVTGINHFTWLTSASYKGMDLLPIYREFALKYRDTGYEEGGDDNWMNSFFNCAQKVKFDLFLRYGAIAAAGDRHLAEFVPRWYTMTPEVARSYKFSLTPVSWRREDLKKRLQRSDDLISGKEKINLKGSGEEGHLLLKALLGLGDIVSNVNVPNRGQCPDLPLGAVVETNALFGFDRIQPVMASPMPSGVLPLVTRHVQNQENALRAILTGDRALALATFMNDPQMGNVSLQDGEQLFDDMLNAQRDYVPEGLLKK